MTTRREEFAVAEHPVVAARLASASLRVLEGDGGRVEVVIDGQDPDTFTVERSGDRIVVEQRGGVWRWGRHRVTVTAPPGVSVDARLASGDLDVDVPLGGLRVEIASGEVRAGDIGGDVEVKSASGDVRLGEVAGDLEVATASGDVRTGSVTGRGEISTASGACVLASAAGRLTVRSASGDIAISRYGGADLQAKSMSGDVRVGFPAGRTLDVDLRSMSGEVRNTFGLDPRPAQEQHAEPARVRVRTVSGGITIGPADAD